MAIKYLAGRQIEGLSSDTKPTNAENGSIFTETDTGKKFVISSGTWSKFGGNLDSLTNVDNTSTPPANNNVLTYTTTGNKWVPAAPPGAGGGEANTLGSVGTGEGTLPGAKVGTTLNVKSLKQGTNVTLTNNTNDVTISTSGITASSSDTLINKTINTTNNIMPFENGFAFSIYQDGGAVKLRNNLTGAITSHATLDPAIDAVLANTNNPTAEIQTGSYNLAGGFTGWILVSKTHIKCQGLVIINVPQGFTYSVWNIVNSSGFIYGITIDGGYYDEQGSSPTYSWVGINIGPTSTGVTAENKFRNMHITRANAVIYIHTTGVTWANDLFFDNIEATGCKYLAYMDHAGTYTLNTSGPNHNHFTNCTFQTTALDTTNHYPQALGGIVGVVGQWNQFTGCVVWDLTGANSSAAPMTIGANANETLVIGGGCTYGVNFVDNGTNTVIIDEWHGLYNKNTTNLYGPTNTFNGLNVTGSLNIVKPSQASLGEGLFNFSVSDASGDSFSLSNSSSVDGVFSPYFISTQNSTTVGTGTVGLYFEATVKSGTDVGGANFCTAISGRRIDGAPMTQRGLFAVLNKFDTEYAFYPDYADFVLNGLRNVILQGLRTTDVTKTANYTLTSTDHVVRCDGSSGTAFTIALPTAASVAGTIYTIIKTDNNAAGIITIDPAGSETIASVSTWYLRTQNKFIIIESDGANWKLIGYSAPTAEGSFRKGATADRTYIAGLSPYSGAALVTGTTGPTVNTLYAMPFMVTEITKFDTIRCQVTTLGASSNLRMGIYYDDGSTMYPGKLMFDSGNISAATTGVKPATITSSLQTFQPGLYWLAYENSATVPQIKALPGTGNCWYFAGADNTIANSGGFAWSVAHTVGTLPDPYTGSATLITTQSAVGTPVPAVGLRAIT